MDNINGDNDIYKPSGLNQVFYGKILKLWNIIIKWLFIKDDKKNTRKRKHISVTKMEHILEDLKADSDICDSDDDFPKEEKVRYKHFF